MIVSIFKISKKCIVIVGLISFQTQNPLFTQEIDSPQEIQTERTIERIGDVGQFAPMVASVALILIKGDKEGGWQYLKGLSANIGATYLLKYMINKPRPNGATDGLAFPSGHTSFAFQGASFVQQRYGWEYGIPAYAIAGFVAYSRIKGINQRHDLFDVIGGALIGIGSTYLFTTPHLKEHFKLSFSSTNQQYMVGITYKF